jgi:hypothetical protein
METLSPVPTHLAQLVSSDFSRKIDDKLATIIREESLPKYCVLPENDVNAESELHEWVINMLHDHCRVLMGTQATPCHKLHTIDPLTPCMGEVVRNIAEEYAWHRGWCRVAKGLTDIPTFPDSQKQTNQLDIYYKNSDHGKPVDGSVRLIFMITAYKDIPQVMRMLTRIYSKRHRYVVVVDKSQAVFATELAMRVRSLGPNVVVLTPYAVVYLASSATRILAHGMAWIYKEFTDWDHFISLTGTDYPLMSIADIEAKLAKRVAMPSLMVWEESAIFEKAFQQYDRKAVGGLVHQALWTIQQERVRQAFSRRRGNEQFGIPLTCDNQTLFVRYSSRKTTQVQYCNDRITQNTYIEFILSYFYIFYFSVYNSGCSVKITGRNTQTSSQKKIKAHCPSMECSECGISRIRPQLVFMTERV